MPADFTPDDVHEVYRAELPDDRPPLIAEITGTGPATHIDLGARRPAGCICA